MRPLTKTYAKEVAVAILLCAMIVLLSWLMTGCAQYERWDQTHEREYRIDYSKGGGSASMTVRPWQPSTRGYSK